MDALPCRLNGIVQKITCHDDQILPRNTCPSGIFLRSDIHPDALSVSQHGLFPENGVQDRIGYIALSGQGIQFHFHIPQQA